MKSFEIKKEFTEKKFIQKVINYAFWLYDERGIIYQIADYDWLHDTLLIQCGYENIILDNDEVYEYFCSQVEQVDLEKLNRDIITLLN